MCVPVCLCVCVCWLVGWHTRFQNTACSQVMGLNVNERFRISENRHVPMFRPFPKERITRQKFSQLLPSTRLLSFFNQFIEQGKNKMETKFRLADLVLLKERKS